MNKLLVPVAIAGALALAGCAGVQADDAASSASPSASAAPEFDLRAALEGIVKRVEKGHGGDVGIALTTAEGTFQAGNEGGGPAWSTIKVPIAIAALRDDAPEYLVDAAIKESDNDAAYALWSQVKWQEDDPTGAIDGVLEAADSSAQWQDADAAGDVSFGYATWLLADQARFGAHLACVPENEYVYKATADIVEWQRYGLTDLDNTHAKGGWGFDEESGLYTQRQFGTLEAGGGSIGIAIMSVYDDAAEVGEDAAWDKASAALDDVAAEIKDLVDAGIRGGDMTAIKGC